jgi:hypothetical protein
VVEVLALGLDQALRLPHAADAPGPPCFAEPAEVFGPPPLLHAAIVGFDQRDVRDLSFDALSRTLEESAEAVVV